ncbi:hypothetical protein [Burkholderia mallei]|uniref:hypothetical protein n=1 Tax=Burkholderia mallei TaxID=13373 RepID=UPI0021B17038|nr:hypothetical protein [Burkholderia mallei]
MIESQIEYVLGALKAMRTERAEAIEVRPLVELEYNNRIQNKLKGTVWSTGGCSSWYLDPRTGKNTTLWPTFTWRFRQETAFFSTADYHLVLRESASEPAAGAGVGERRRRDGDRRDDA